MGNDLKDKLLVVISKTYPNVAFGEIVKVYNIVKSIDRTMKVLEIGKDSNLPLQTLAGYFIK